MWWGRDLLYIFESLSFDKRDQLWICLLIGLLIHLIRHISDFLLVAKILNEFDGIWRHRPPIASARGDLYHQDMDGDIPSLKPNSSFSWKSMIGTCIFCWSSPFLGDMLVFLGVYIYISKFTQKFKKQKTPAFWKDVLLCHGKYFGYKLRFACSVLGKKIFPEWLFTSDLPWFKTCRHYPPVN